MAFPVQTYNGGVCPQSHPVAIYSVFYEFFYDMSIVIDPSRLVYAMGDPTGYGLHGDFLQGWTNQQALEKAMTTCTGPGGVTASSCSLVVNGSPGSASAQVPQVAPPGEQVGLNGPLKALPGNNPITGKPVKHNARKFRY